MHVESLALENIRIIREARLEPHPALNLLQGPNGAGKTSVLESLHLLSDGRTFRHALVRPLIREQQRLARVVGTWSDAQGRLHQGGVEKSRDGSTRIRLNRVDCGAIDAARAFPVHLFSRDHDDLVSDGPGVRRRLLDWVMFHVEPSFYETWKRFRRALKQRNQLLRRGRMAAAELDAWDTEFVEASLLLDALRQKHARTLFDSLHWPIRLIDGAESALQSHYAPGWDQRKALAELVASGRERDIQSGYTRQGPHRADWQIQWHGSPPDRMLSTGQRKLLGWGLRLDAVRYVKARGPVSPVLLVDEMGADLDLQHMARLAQGLSSLECQLFCASVAGSTERQVWTGCGEGRMFHVEHGEVQQTGNF